MASQELTYRFTAEEFVRAWEAGVFSEPVEFVDGAVRPVPIGRWHGDTTMLAARALPNDAVVFTSESLVMDGSVPDPDFWVRPRGAAEVGRLGERLAVWRTEDVLLVVEVADETVAEDLGTKARLYSGAGYRLYWALTREGLYEPTDPTAAGYRVRTLRRRGESAALPWTDTPVAIDALLAVDP